MRHPLRRRWVVWFALLGLLFQQAAMAAYVCPLGVAAEFGIARSAGTDDRSSCEQMAMPDALRCQQHCSPQQVAPPSPPVTDVPAALPAALPSFVSLEVLGTRAPDVDRTPLHCRATAPPLTVRDCSFQL